MADKLAGVINYLIGAGLMAFILVIVKNKNAEQPNLKYMGMSYKTVRLIIYSGIAIDIILIIAQLSVV